MNSNRDKGIRAERDLAKYLRQWFPSAERSVAGGFKSTGGGTVVRESQDRGDLRDACLPHWPIAWQCKDVVKSHPKGLANQALFELLAETRRQRDAAGATAGFLVEKRAGHANPATWWVHLDALELAAIGYGRWLVFRGVRSEDPGLPVRLELGSLMSMLERYRYAPVPQITTIEQESTDDPTLDAG